MDYRRLNSATLKDSYPLTRIDDSIDAKSGACWLSTFDLASGYWQVEVEEKDRPTTAFTTGSCLYHFTVMRFGLCNAPATFEGLMGRVLSGPAWEAAFCTLRTLSHKQRPLKQSWSGNVRSSQDSEKQDLN